MELQAIIDKLFGYDKKSDIVHSKTNKFTHEMLKVQRKARKLCNMHDETAYKIGVSTGRIK